MWTLAETSALSVGVGNKVSALSSWSFKCNLSLPCYWYWPVWPITLASVLGSSAAAPTWASLMTFTGFSIFVFILIGGRVCKVCHRLSARMWSRGGGTKTRSWWQPVCRWLRLMGCGRFLHLQFLHFFDDIVSLWLQIISVQFWRNLQNRTTTPS